MMYKKKKILIIAFYFPPENNGGTERVKQFYNRLSDEASETYVFTADKTLRDVLKRKHSDKRIIYSWLIWMFLRIYYKLIRKTGTSIEFLYKIAEVLIYNKFRNKKPDICIASFPPVYDFDVGLILKRKFCSALVADFRDGLMYEPFDDIVNANIEERKKLNYLEKKIAMDSDLIITAVPQITEYIKNKYHVQAYTIPNGFDDEEIIKECPIQLSCEKKYIVYTGALDASRYGLFSYAKDSLNVLFQNIADAVFIFVGNYTNEEKIFFKQFDNVVVFKQVERNAAIAIQRKANVLLLVTGDMAFGTSGKLYEYLFSGKPILNIGGNNNAKKIIEETNSGVTISPESTETMCCFIKKTIKENSKFKRKNIEKYTRKKQCLELKKMIEKI